MHVGIDGLRFTVREDAVLDVLMGHRVWSFNPIRDAKPDGPGWLVRWPGGLVSHLTGRGRVVVQEHPDGTVLHDEEVDFGGSGPLEVVDARGNPVSVDKGGHVVRSFSERDDAVAAQIAARTAELLDFLNEEAGVPAYLCFGALLGAVRTGHLIGHDNDADVGFLSRHEHPADIMLESLRLERLVQRRGWPTHRMSGDDFKAYLPLDDGSTTAIDVFGSFYVGGVFHLLPAVRGELDRSALLPLGSITLEGHEVTAPARPEELLALTYGEGWRRPDPSFKYQTPDSTWLRFRHWFRGERDHLRAWNARYSRDQGPPAASELAVLLHEQLAPGSRVLELGAGLGVDAAYLAERGHDVAAYDYSTVAVKQLRRLASTHPTLVAGRLNLYDTRAALALGALTARRPAVDALVLRRVLDDLRDDGRRNVWLLARMALRRGGRLHLEFAVNGEREHDPFRPFRPRVVRRLSADRVADEIAAYGGTVEGCETLFPREPAAEDEPETCRLVARWS